MTEQYIPSAILLEEKPLHQTPENGVTQVSLEEDVNPLVDEEQFQRRDEIIITTVVIVSPQDMHDTPILEAVNPEPSPEEQIVSYPKIKSRESSGQGEAVYGGATRRYVRMTEYDISQRRLHITALDNRLQTLNLQLAAGNIREEEYDGVRQDLIAKRRELSQSQSFARNQLRPFKGHFVPSYQ